MSNSVEAISVKYLTAKKLSGGTRKEYKSTVNKWTAWGNGVDVDKINRSHIRDFLDWVHDQAAKNGGSNPGRTANKARENLRAIMSWAWEHDYVAKLPAFPKPKPQRDVAGRHYLTKPDLNALYFATYQLPQLRGWKHPFTVGHYWRAALVVFFNYGVDIGPMALAAFSVHGALSDHHRLIRQFGADPLMYYLDGENAIIKTTESDPHVSVPLQPQQNHLKTTSRWTDESS